MTDEKQRPPAQEAARKRFMPKSGVPHVVYPDRDIRNADASKAAFDLPRFKSPEFMHYLATQGMSLDEFRKLPIYSFAVENGLITNDQWTGDDVVFGEKEAE